MFKYAIKNKDGIQLYGGEREYENIIFGQNGDLVNYKDTEFRVINCDFTVLDMKKDLELLKINLKNIKNFCEKYGLLLYKDTNKKEYYLIIEFQYWTCLIDVKNKIIHNLSIETDCFFDYVKCCFYSDITLLVFLERVRIKLFSPKEILFIDEEIKLHTFVEFKKKDNWTCNVIKINDKYGLEFKDRMYFITKEEYNNLSGSYKTYYIIKNKLNYTVIKNNSVKTINFNNLKLATSYDTDIHFSRIFDIDNKYSIAYKDNTYFLVKVDEDNKKINLVLESVSTYDYDNIKYVYNNDKVYKFKKGK